MKFTLEQQNRILASATTRRILEDVADDIVDTTRSRTPVDSGLLKHSWYWRVSQRTNSVTKRKAWGITITDEAPYAFYVEFGTKKMGGRFMLSSSLRSHGVKFTNPLLRAQDTFIVPRSARINDRHGYMKKANKMRRGR